MAKQANKPKGTRKPTRQKRLTRDEPKRHPKDLVLIICEGVKTEQNYFEDMRQSQNDWLTDIHVYPGRHSDSSPSRLIEIAREQDSANIYSYIYCVYDGDEARRSKEASQKLKKISRRGNAIISTIESIPCFEYWILLHYIFKRTLFSSCDDVLNAIRKETPLTDYQKNMRDLYTKTEAALDTAITHAKRAKQQAEMEEEPNPSTDMHRLIEQLQNIVAANNDYRP